MSLCILLRTPDGGALMAADTAVSTIYEGVPYRVTNEEDHEKVIVHLGHMIFCSGNLERCRALRVFIRSLSEIDYDAISAFAQQIWGGDTSDDSTGILICQPDNGLIGMLSAHNFEITELSWDKDRMDVQTLGFKMQEAYGAACIAAEDAEDWMGVVLAAYSAAICEEVGGELHVFSRKAEGEIERMALPLPESRNIRKGVFVALNTPLPAYHAIVQARDFLDKNGKSVMTKEGKVSGEYLDLRGVNIVDDDGDVMITIDKTGIHWTQKYSPFKTQYSVSANGPWHDDFATNYEYRRDTSDGGTTWSKGYKFVAKDGLNGTNGSDASVNYNNIKAALQKASSLQSAFMTVDEMGAPKIYGGEIYGAKIYAGYSGGVGTGSVISLTDDGINMYNDKNNTNLTITSQKIGTYGAITMLAGGASGLCMDGRAVLLGSDMGSTFAKGIAFDYPTTNFYGEMDFSKATTIGLHSTFA